MLALAPGLLAGSLLTAAAVAQGSGRLHAALEVTDHRGVVSSATHATTGNPYPHPPTTPPGYGSGGVPTWTRAWHYTPRQRARFGQDGDRYLTVRGVTQTILPGAAQAVFPGPSDEWFAAGWARVDAVAAPHGHQHSADLADVFVLPAASLAFTGPAPVRVAMTLTTPIVVPEADGELCLFVEYSGGQQRDDPTRGQTIGADYYGGHLPVTGATYHGFALGPRPGRTVLLGTERSWRPQIGLLIDEPVLAATGYHAGHYQTPPLPGADYLGVAAMESDWSSFNTPHATLFFHVSAGRAFAGGVAVVLMDFAPSLPSVATPTPFGRLWVDPGNLLFSVLGAAPLPLDADGVFAAGPAAPIRVPILDPATRGHAFTFQAAVADAALASLRLTNASSIVSR